MKKKENMKKEFDFSKMKQRPNPKYDPNAAKMAISLRLDGSIIADLKTEAYRLGIPYQTLIGSILHRYVTGDLVDKKPGEPKAA